jgi:hypothetical protein
LEQAGDSAFHLEYTRFRVEEEEAALPMKVEGDFYLSARGLVS